jgi:integrase/recombinase XerC
MTLSADTRPDGRASTAAAMLTGSGPLSSHRTRGVPEWFIQFLNDPQSHQLSETTFAAYRNDFCRIAAHVTAGDPAALAVTDITEQSLHSAFADYTPHRAPATVRRCWSTWNRLCTYLHTTQQLTDNPMQAVSRPMPTSPLARALPRPAVDALLETVARDRASTSRTVWPERDVAIILTILLTGLSAEELHQPDVADIRTRPDGLAMLHLNHTSRRKRTIPIEPELLSVIEDYLHSRATRFSTTLSQAPPQPSGLSEWPARTPLFVGTDGKRITNQMLHTRIRRTFKHAGPHAQTVTDALINGLDHTMTGPASSAVGTYTLINLLHPPRNAPTPGATRD